MAVKLSLWISSQQHSSIQTTSIKDLHRLEGNEERPRALLVKMIRAADVSKILSKRQLFQSKISIRPNLPFDRVKYETLTEWEIVSTPRRCAMQVNQDMKVEHFINKVLHGKLDLAWFKICESYWNNKFNECVLIIFFVSILQGALALPQMLIHYPPNLHPCKLVWMTVSLPPLSHSNHTPPPQKLHND